jgi:hypothetical protein
VTVEKRSRKVNFDVAAGEFDHAVRPCRSTMPFDHVVVDEVDPGQGDLPHLNPSRFMVSRCSRVYGITASSAATYR